MAKENCYRGQCNHKSYTYVLGKPILWRCFTAIFYSNTFLPFIYDALNQFSWPVYETTCRLKHKSSRLVYIQTTIWKNASDIILGSENRHELPIQLIYIMILLGKDWFTHLEVFFFRKSFKWFRNDTLETIFETMWLYVYHNYGPFYPTVIQDVPRS